MQYVKLALEVMAVGTFCGSIVVAALIGIDRYARSRRWSGR